MTLNSISIALLHTLVVLASDIVDEQARDVANRVACLHRLAFAEIFVSSCDCIRAARVAVLLVLDFGAIRSQVYLFREIAIPVVSRKEIERERKVY